MARLGSILLFLLIPFYLFVADEMFSKVKMEGETWRSVTERTHRCWGSKSNKESASWLLWCCFPTWALNSVGTIRSGHRPLLTCSTQWSWKYSVWFRRSCCLSRLCMGQDTSCCPLTVSPPDHAYAVLTSVLCDIIHSQRQLAGLRSFKPLSKSVRHLLCSCFYCHQVLFRLPGRAWKHLAKHLFLYL